MSRDEGFRTPEAHFDGRFSDPAADPAEWTAVEEILKAAELFWITTVRGDGRPHVTPLVAVHLDGAVHFCTGPEEQKGRNLARNAQVALTTGANRWAKGTDVVLEGTAVRVEDRPELERLASAYLEKYGEDWRFAVGEGGFHHGDAGLAHVFRVEPRKVIAFAKDPHGQTTFRF
jgi:general stress protein 26